jgi:type III restriction enzyme
LKRIVRQWMTTHLRCVGGTYPAQLFYQELAEMAANKIHKAITSTYLEERPVRVSLDPYNPSGSTRFVNFNTSKPDRWTTRPDKSHVNLVILDSDWEAEFCRVVENHPRTLAYVKNHNMGFEVPYLMGSEPKTYIPDFIVKVDDGHGPDDPLYLVVEIKGYRREDAKEKKTTMDSYWIPGVNRHGGYGRWAHAEFKAMFTMVDEYEVKIREELDRILEPLISEVTE